MVVTNKQGQMRNLGQDAADIVDAILDSPNWEGTYLGIVTDYNTQKPQLDRAISIVARNRGLDPDKVLKGLTKVINGISEGFDRNVNANLSEEQKNMGNILSKASWKDAAYGYEAQREDGSTYIATDQDVSRVRETFQTNTEQDIDDSVNGSFLGRL